MSLLCPAVDDCGTTGRPFLYSEKGGGLPDPLVVVQRMGILSSFRDRYHRLSFHKSDSGVTELLQEYFTPGKKDLLFCSVRFPSNIHVSTPFFFQSETKQQRVHWVSLLSRNLLWDTRLFPIG